MPGVGGWYKTPRSVVRRVLRRYGAQAFAVLGILFEARDDHSLIVQGVTQEELGRLLRLSERQVRRVTEPLEEDGLLRTVRQGPRAMLYVLSDDFNVIVKKIGEDGVAPREDQRRIGGPLFDQTAEFGATKDRTWVSGQESETNAKTGHGCPVNEKRPDARPDTRPDTRPDMGVRSDRDFHKHKVLRKETRDKRQEKTKSLSSSSSFPKISPSKPQTSKPVPSGESPSSQHSSSQHIDRQQVLKWLQGWVPSLNWPEGIGVIEETALEKLIEGCVAMDSKATGEEICYFIAQKGRALYRGIPNEMGGSRLEPRADIHSPLGFLTKAVINCFEGEHSAAEQYRRSPKTKAASG